MSDDASSISDNDEHLDKRAKTTTNEVSCVIGPTWMDALSNEFSKPKFKQVLYNYFTISSRN